LENAARRLKRLARRHRENNATVFAAAVRKAAHVLNGRIILINRAQRLTARSGPAAHPLQSVLSDLLEVTRSLAVSVTGLVSLPVTLPRF
jgi:hypothetical protein